MADSKNAFGSAATYQSVIIALVAGGILTTGIISIIWRRRRYRELERALEAASRMGRGRGRVEKEVGRSPDLWDVIVGEGDVRAGTEGKSEDRNKGEKEDDAGAGIRDEREPDVGGTMQQGWNPTSIALISEPRGNSDSGSESRNHDPRPTKLEMTVLIAMPSSFSTSYPRKSKYLDDYPVLYTTPSETYLFPALELASTKLPVSVFRAEEEVQIEGMMDAARAWRGGASRPGSPAGEVRFERADVFRTV